MNNNKTLKALAAVCAVLLLAVAIVRFLPLAHAEQYHVGDAEISAAVRNLEIEWTSGAVHIAYHSGNTVILSEKTAGAISEDMRMRWRLDGDTLRIEYDQPGFHWFSMLPHDKELTVTLPQGHTFQEASISSTSADLDIPALYADILKLKSTSGDIRVAVNARILQGKATSGDMEIQALSMAEEITLASTSGKITLEAAGAERKTEIDSTSGAIRAAMKQTGQFKAESTSGDVYAVIGETKEAKIKSTSGKVIVEIARMEALDIHTTSGAVTAYLPQTPGFTARIETVSGHVEHHLPLTKQDKDYIAGDGSGAVKIHTTSGSITVNGKEN